MRHKIGNINTGLGNSSKCLLTNTWSDDNELNKVIELVLKDALNLEFIKEYGGLDFKVDISDKLFSIDFGYEPAYQYDELLIYHIENDKENCSVKKGKAQGVYGSDIKITLDVALDGADDEFKQFVEKWHDKLLKVL